MKLQIIAYIATALVFLGFDAIWLSQMGDKFYRPIIGSLMLDKFSPSPAIIFYLLYVLGMVIFAVSPAISSGKWTIALTSGAMFGFFAYTTYDLSNQATLKSWTTLLSVTDIAWGTIVTGVSATLGYLIATSIARWTGSDLG
jgi:uncharacterized membrane protein